MSISVTLAFCKAEPIPVRVRRPDWQRYINY